VCSMQLQPDSARSIAIGSADHKIYCYDLHNIRAPYCTLSGHSKTVSYAKYLDASRIVSASRYNSLKLWDMSRSPGRDADSPIQTYTGHTNTKVRYHVRLLFCYRHTHTLFWSYYHTFFNE
jgi:WD40 repeat protein